MLRITFVVVICACALQLMFSEPVSASAAEPNAAGKSGRLGDVGVRRAVGLDRVQAFGWLGERVDRAHRAVQNVRSSIWWNLGNEWGWEHAARWLRNMSYFAAYTGERDPAMVEDVERFLRMSADGSLGLDYAKLQIGAYEDGEVLKALLTYYDLSGDRRVLEVAKKVGRRIAEQHHLTAHYYKPLAITGLLRLSALAGDSSFKKLAIDIAEEKQLEFLKMKAHGAAAAMISDSYLDLYQATGNRRYLDWALQGWPAIRDRMFATGGLGEVIDFAAPPGESDVLCETCQVSWWMIYNLHLWRVTGNIEYMDMAERILYNHFAFSQAHRGEGGGFCAGGNVDQGMRGIHNYFCCDNEGTLGLLEVLTHMYAQDAAKRTVDVNLFFKSEARLDIGGREVRIRQTTDYPERGALKISVDTQSPVSFTLRVRIPGWTRAASATVNGKPVSCATAGSYVAIARKWTRGDTLSVVFPMPMRVEADITGRDLRSGLVKLDGKDAQAKRIAVFYGPVVAAMFRTGHGNDLNWVWTGDYTDVLDSGGDAGQGYPTSKSDILELDGKTYDSGGVPPITRVESANGVPELSWDVRLGEKVWAKYRVRVLPGLPVTLESREEVSGWDGKGRLLCSGLRFATIKDAGGGYGVCSLPYPVPCVTAKPDLDNHIVWGGVYGLYERLANDAKMPTTGTFFLNNGYFGAICVYDPKPAESVVCRQTEKYAGLYIEPKAGSDVTISRRLVFPLADRPRNQTTARQMMDKASQVTARLTGEPGKTQTLVLSGPVLQGAPVLVPKAIGIQAGWVIHNDRIASNVFDYDSANYLVYVDVPGKYHLIR